MKTFLTLFLIGLFSSSAVANLNSDNLKSISGEYSNKRGDSMVILMDPIIKEQEDLFTPLSFSLTIDLLLNDSIADGIDQFSLSERHYKGKNDGVFLFNKVEDGCDNSGCANYELSLRVLPKKNGGYWAKAKIEVSVDVLETAEEEMSDEDFNNMTDESLGAFCAKYFNAPSAQGYADGVICDYQIETFLSLRK